MNILILCDHLNMEVHQYWFSTNIDETTVG